MAERGSPLTTSRSTAVLVSTNRPATVALLCWDLPITALRALSVALFLLALVLTVWTLRGSRRRPGPQAVLGHRLVHTHNVDLAGRPVVDVDTVDVLVGKEALTAAAPLRGQ